MPGLPVKPFGMWTLEAPSETGRAAAMACVHRIRNADLRERVRAHLDSFESNSSSYRAVLEDDAAHELNQQEFDVPEVSKTELIWLYDNQLSRPGRPGREIYNSLMLLAPYGLCAYCQYGLATTLDHFVPKVAIAGLAIEPLNLVPCCKDCNHILGELFSESSGFQLLHPYFLPKIGRWLFARADERDGGVVLQFFAKPAQEVPDAVKQRIVNQFATLRLGERYATVSGVDLPEIAAQLPQLFKATGSEGVRQHLMGMAIKSTASGINSRRAVIYEALAASDWYCSGGFIET